ncbi:MAG: Rpn family recombination-promoting nuclease/putative transposase [Planctomycetaceae bacterium]|nr:Rpn family recombination-promoting nuclease/putative transposase [Planctomycetaceae bacterium]
MSRYINPYTDFGFKRLFGEEANKDLLIDFLNAFLPEHHRIATLDFRNTEQLGVVTADRSAVYDVYCTAESGEHFIVEMQKAAQLWFKDRALFYASFPIRDQAPKGMVDGVVWDYRLQPVYLIAILGFEYDENEERRKLERIVKLKDQDGDVFYDKLEFRFLQMPLFTKTESELETQKDKWYYFLKHLPSLEKIPEILREPVFERAFETAEIAAMSKDEVFAYEASLKTIRDNFSALKTAEAKGEAGGIAKVARNMKNEGFDSDVIARMTGLSLEEIDQLKSEK